MVGMFMPTRLYIEGGGGINFLPFLFPVQYRYVSCIVLPPMANEDR